MNVRSRGPSLYKYRLSRLQFFASFALFFLCSYPSVTSSQNGERFSRPSPLWGAGGGGETVFRPIKDASPGWKLPAEINNDIRQ